MNPLNNTNSTVPKYNYLYDNYNIFANKKTDTILRPQTDEYSRGMPYNCNYALYQGKKIIYAQLDTLNNTIESRSKLYEQIRQAYNEPERTDAQIEADLDIFLQKSQKTGFDLYMSIADTFNDKIMKIMEEYSKGKTTDIDAINDLKKTFKDLRFYQTLLEDELITYPAGQSKLLKDFYSSMQISNVRFSYNANYTEGSEINKNYGNPEDFRFTYYNSKYYHQSEHMHKLLKSTVHDLVKEWNCESITESDFDEIESSTGGCYHDYQKHWSSNTTMNMRTGKLIDTSIAPPKDFIFFFKMKKYSNETQKNLPLHEATKGILIFEGKDFRIERDVDFNFTRSLGPLKTYYRGHELIDINNSRLASKYNLFLSNLLIFADFRAPYFMTNNDIPSE
ncbi:protein of unknown function [Acetoanaerobium sticklandii]|uniref:Uncharacterized protein n=1 Tax=Acetoanaerobium sticklandii (strain ATCC 12662 / DSM 519 / JCM 1433 / CCUG 9281 / NCIMB 10654 / HF) TaxID=499177 RepID=E3PX04_ACESD|nr:hypothetical protein [Acetoanaerobium sticklandii]CBH20969.1 protein of unknown function [Acetoanaerobium sticklandii]